MTVFTLLVNEEIVYMSFSYPQDKNTHNIDFISEKHAAI